MKIRQDFITNSSSIGYILAIPPDMIGTLEADIAELNDIQENQNEGVNFHYMFDNIKELETFTNDGPFDWASFPRGLQYTNITESHYNLCKGFIKKGLTVAEVRVDYNACDEFEDSWRQFVLETYT